MLYVFFFFFNDTATTEIYTLSLHDALPISRRVQLTSLGEKETHVVMTSSVDPSYFDVLRQPPKAGRAFSADRKSTRLNSSHANISYAVFCLKKKKKKNKQNLGCHLTHIIIT